MILKAPSTSNTEFLLHQNLINSPKFPISANITFYHISLLQVSKTRKVNLDTLLFASHSTMNTILSVPWVPLSFVLSPSSLLLLCSHSGGVFSNCLLTGLPSSSLLLLHRFSAMVLFLKHEHDQIILYVSYTSTKLNFKKKVNASVLGSSGFHT